MKKLFYTLPLLFIPNMALACDYTTLLCKYDKWRDKFYPGILLYEQIALAIVASTIAIIVIAVFWKIAKKTDE